MEAIEMVGLLLLALIVGAVVQGMWKAHNHWKNEAEEWRRQVDDERTR